jgi:hypothetical protein
MEVFIPNEFRWWQLIVEEETPTTSASECAE